MDVQKSHFPIELVKIIQSIADSHFIAFDLEFSGVADRRRTTDGSKLTLQQLYDDNKEAAEKYQVLQVGLTIVKEDAKRGCYIARPYNFNISPIPSVRERYFGRVWSFHSGAVGFLQRQGFRFDLPMTHGIPYLSHKEEGEARANWIREDEKRAEIPNMELKPRDQPLVDHIRKTIRKWQAQSKAAQEEYQNIPAEIRGKGVPEVLSRYQVRLTHQIIRNEYPKLRTTGMGSFVQVTNPTDEQQASERANMTKERERQIANAVGFRWLIDAIIGNDISRLPNEYLLSAIASDGTTADEENHLKNLLEELQGVLQSRRRVLVGHNCFTDLMYLYRCFVGDLPANVETFRELIHDKFPAVIDTKYLATYPKKWNTSLEEVEVGLRTEAYPRVEVPVDFDRYEFNEIYHEAGYDSLITAKIAVKLSAKMAKEGAFTSEDCKKFDSRAFGSQEKGHTTAQDSVTDADPGNTGISTAISNVLITPITAVKSFFQADKALESSEKVAGNEQEQPDRRTLQQETSNGSVLAVRQKPLDWSKPKEIKKVKEAYSKSNIFEVLQEDSGGTHDTICDTELEGPISFSSNEEKVTNINTGGTAATASKKAEMMPEWDDDNGFWRLFGNRLQVNGCQEGVFRLSQEYHNDELALPLSSK